MKKKPTILLILLALLISVNSFATIRYVTTTGAGTNTGNSWGNAASDLQLTINNSSSEDEIWVASGTYKPNRKANDTGTITANDRNNAFVLKSGVKIYGGFAGAENLLTQRNWATNATILSGDLGTSGNASDNAYHVVISSGNVGTAELNGFTISDGNADADASITVNSISISSGNGGGVFCTSSSPTLSNLIILSCTGKYSGGGVYNTSSSPTINKVRIASNSANQKGGGIYNTTSSSPIMTDVVICNNSISDGWANGGGMYNESSCNPTITNSIIYKNIAKGNGGGIYNNGGAPVLKNTTIAYNQVIGTGGNGNGAGISGNMTLSNCIIWGNTVDAISKNVEGTPTFNYCLVENGTVSGTGIISNAIPVFENASTDDYRLKGWSPAVNSGSNADNNTTTDLDGNSRIFNGGTIDLGPYEYQSENTAKPESTTILYVKKGSTGTGTSWTNAYGELSDALLYANESGTVAQIWVAAGTYYPLYFAGSGSSNNEKSFVMQRDLKIYGGFAGTETSLTQRNWKTNVTTLSGNSISYHVVIASGDAGTGVLDGFVITGSASTNSGSSTTVNSNSIAWANGGGIYCHTSSPAFSNLIIYLNYSGASGAAIYCTTSSNPTLNNTLIHKNTPGQEYAITSVNTSIPTFNNATIVNNAGGGLKGTFTVNNSIVWNNNGNPNNVSGTITYNSSLIGGATPGGGIISTTDPLFVNAAADNYELTSASPARNAGFNSYTSGIATDLSGNPRIDDVNVDLGAYEVSSILYVKKGMTGTGGSWANAFGELGDALETAKTLNATSAGTIKQIWVTKGTYIPTIKAGNSLNPKDKAFVLAKDVKIFGGFTGSETLVTQRDSVNISQTILSGDIGNINDAADNTHHLVISAGDVGTAELNGFTITESKGMISTVIDLHNITVNGQIITTGQGAGIYCSSSSPLLRNLFITKNWTYYGMGAGMYIYDSSPTCENLKITMNISNRNSYGSGAGIAILANSKPTFTNLIVSNNLANGTDANGGGIYNVNSDPTINNGLIYKNVAYNLGGGIFNKSGTGKITLINTTIAYNIAYLTGTTTTDEAAGVHEDNITLKNSIIWGANYKEVFGAQTYEYCLIKGGAVDGTKIVSNNDPMFKYVDPKNEINQGTPDIDNYRVSSRFSPAINIGNNALKTTAKDMDGNKRIFDDITIDLGPYEYSSLTASSNFMTDTHGVLYVKKGMDGLGNGWTEAIGELGDALYVADKLNVVTPGTVKQIWVAKGTYAPNRKIDALGAITPTDRDNTFVLQPGIKIYGGFNGTETLVTQRDSVSADCTILSGIIKKENSDPENTYHVVVASGNLNNAELNSFTITGGKANGSSSRTINSILVNQGLGGGICLFSASPILRNLTIKNNYGGINGGGVYLNNSSPSCNSLNIQSNNTLGCGGGIYLESYSAPTLSNTIIANNTAGGGNGGGGIYSNASKLTLTNVSITKNQAKSIGGGLALFFTGIDAIRFSNLTIAHNSTTLGSAGEEEGKGAGLYIKGGTSPATLASNIQLNNSIIWGNTYVGTERNVGTYSTGVGVTLTYANTLLEGGTVSGSTIVSTADPKFKDPANGDFSLSGISPAIDLGNNSFITGFPTDAARKTRTINTNVDLGAYEFQGSIIVNGAFGIPNKTAYLSLKDAFTAINNTGNAVCQKDSNIVITVEGHTNETNLGYTTLDNRGWNSLKLYPTLSGCILKGSAPGTLLGLKGTSNVTVDGRINQIGEIADLTLINTATNAGATTVKFTNAAHDNTVKYCNLHGNDKNSNFGVIVFDGYNNATDGGNYNNTVANCTITSYDNSTRLSHAIYSNALSGYPNTGNTISNNKIFNTTPSSGVSSASNISINGYSSNFSITGNHFYETNAITFTNDMSINAISINTGENGNNFTVSGNFIGGKKLNCDSTSLDLFCETSNKKIISYNPIYLNVGSTTPSTVQGNVIQNISNINSSSAIPFVGIHIAGGKVNIGTVTGNTIGKAATTSSISISTSPTTTSPVNAISYGILIDTPEAVNCQNNTISGITTNTITPQSDANTSSIIGIYKTAKAGTTVISNNTIGNKTTANSLYASSISTGAAQSIIGIKSDGTGDITINSNVIANLNNATTNSTAASTGKVNGILSSAGKNTISGNLIKNLSIANANTASSELAAVGGIVLTGTANANTVTADTILNLSNTNSSFAGSIHGIYFNGNTGANTVSTNFLHNFTVNAASTTASVYGIKAVTGVTTYANNIISLKPDSKTTCYGIYDAGATGQNSNLYYNTLSIGGTLPVGSTNKSYCLYSNANANTRDYRNNIFNNTRTTSGGTNLHYAAYFNYTTAGSLQLNNNDYYAPGAGGVLSYFNGATVNTLPTISGFDIYSVSENPVFTNDGSAAATDYQIGVDMVAATGTGIGTDFGAAPRNAFSAIGAWERNMPNNQWKGYISTAWNNAGNWLFNTVPETNTDIYFATVPRNNLVMDTDYTVNDIINAQSIKTLVTNGHKLTVKGDLDFSNGAKINASATGSQVEFSGAATQSIPAGAFLNDEVDELVVNNAHNIQLNGTLAIKNTITATSGKLDTETNSATVSYAGTTAQLIDNSPYLDAKVYNLTIDNAAGVSLSNDFVVENLLTINSGKKLTIPVNKQLTVTGTITNNAGVSGLVVKAGANDANGSLTFNNAENSPVLGTVEMYTKAYYDANATGNKYKWQYFGIPLRSIKADPTFYGSYLRKYVESSNTYWQNLSNSSILESFKGYEVTQTNAKTIYFQGILENRNRSLTLSNTPDVLQSGNHIISNPYTRAININDLAFTDMEATVYLYNTGSREDWSSNKDNTVSLGNVNTPGQYISIPKNTAGLIAGIPTEICSMQGFMVKANASGGTLILTYNTGTTKNTQKQRIKAQTEPTVTTITVSGAKYSDKMWLIIEPTCTHNFDNGWDGSKIFGSALAPQIYAAETAGQYQINTVNDIDNTKIGFRKGEDSYYTLTFNHQNIENAYAALYLVDLEDNSYTDISLDGSTYSFVADPNSTLDARFEIVTKPGVTTELESAENTVRIHTVDQQIFIRNKTGESGNLKVYTLSGEYLETIKYAANAVTKHDTKLNTGIYIVKDNRKNETINQKILINGKN